MKFIYDKMNRRCFAVGFFAQFWFYPVGFCIDIVMTKYERGVKVSRGRQGKGNKQKKKKPGMLNSFLAEVFEVPEDLALDMPRITLIGNIKLSVENHKGIMEYKKNEIRLRVNDGFLVAKGRNLSLKNISNDEVLLQGEIMQMAIVLDESEDFAFGEEV